MGEISKRTKHKWMRWTTKGLETILNLILTRYVSEESYLVFKHTMMKSDNLRFIKGEVEIISAGGGYWGPYCIMTYTFMMVTDQWCDDCDQTIEDNRNHF